MAVLLQLLFTGLSLVSTLILIIMALKNWRVKKREWLILLLPYLLLLCTIAYSFDWMSNSNNDLFRYFYDFRMMKSAGFMYEFRHADTFSFLYRVIAWIFCHLENYSWYPVFTISVEYGIYFYVIVNIADEKKFSGLDIILCIMLRLALIPPVMSISASRNTVAYALFSLGIYFYYKYGLKSKGMYICMFLGIMMHTTVLIGVVIFGISLLAHNKPAVNFIMLFWALAINLIMYILQKINIPYLEYIVYKWNYYINHPTNFDVVKSKMIILWLVALAIVCYVWFFMYKKNSKQNRIAYYICHISANLGSYVSIPELFLRLNYPTAMVFPILLGEIKMMEQLSGIKRKLLMGSLLCIVVFGFLRTGCGWIYQIYWYLE